MWVPESGLAGECNTGTKRSKLQGTCKTVNVFHRLVPVTSAKFVLFPRNSFCCFHVMSIAFIQQHYPLSSRLFFFFFFFFFFLFQIFNFFFFQTRSDLHKTRRKVFEKSRCLWGEFITALNSYSHHHRLVSFFFFVKYLISIPLSIQVTMAR